ncbi:MAG: ABC transporter ATP-binding protein [Planctomycetota bacterium]
MHIHLTDVHVEYLVGLELTTKDAVLGIFGVRKHPARKVNALRGVNLQIHAGERVGIVGLNGAGKSTLLRVAGGVYPPTQGTVDIAGRVSCLFDVAQGFDDSATGHENIVTRSLVLGATMKQIRERRDEIAAFCELGEFLDLPVRTYSAGMRLRLAFAISTAYDCELLLLDEVVAAGDEAFRKKAYTRIRELIARSAILMFASHSPESVKELCERAIWVHDGLIKRDGPAAEVVDEYVASV